MTSKERVRKAICHENPDIVPADFACVKGVMENLKKHYGFSEDDEVYDKFQSDIRFVDPTYIGPELKSYYEDGLLVEESYFGYKSKYHWNGLDYNPITCYYPLNGDITTEDIDNFNWPKSEWFDYESVKRQCDKYKDKAIIMGHAGVYQFSTFLRDAEKLYMEMALDPELAHKMYDRFVQFELEHYEKILKAADGRIDILRCYDDYGTQTSMLFSTQMWKDYFMDNTKKLSSLAHKYGAYYMQHSCGAIRPIIPMLIEAGADLLDPIQKAQGLEPEGLKKDFGDNITFHGGIDTQFLLPSASPEEVKKETKHFIDVLNNDGGYILCSSQELQMDTPIENIEAMYAARFE